MGGHVPLIVQVRVFAHAHLVSLELFANHQSRVHRQHLCLQPVLIQPLLARFLRVVAFARISITTMTFRFQQLAHFHVTNVSRINVLTRVRSVPTTLNKAFVKIFTLSTRNRFLATVLSLVILASSCLLLDSKSFDSNKWNKNY